jgi:hypothetical protein
MWCWWCCHPFEGLDLHLPYKYDDKTKRFTTMGHFCSWGCMKSYNLDKNSMAKYGEIGMYITLMHKLAIGKTELIKSAPHRYALQVFGGTLSIEEFRASTHHNKILVMPDETHKIQSVMDFVKPESKMYAYNDNVGDSKMDEIHKSSGKNETLKLKRNKPLKREETSTLENSLGIKRVAKPGFTF